MKGGDKMKTILWSSALSALTVLLLPGESIAQSASDSVDVSMDVQIARNLEFGLDGNVAIDSSNTQTLTFYDEFGAPSYSQEIHIGYTEGCVHLEGVDRVTITMTGQNPAPDGTGPYLKYTDGSANDYFLNYFAQIVSRFDSATPWSTIIPEAYNFAPDRTGFQGVSGMEYGPNGPLNIATTNDMYLLGAVGGDTQSGCNGGTENNLALIVGVGTQDGHAYDPGDGSSRIHFRSVNDLSGSSTLPADVPYAFSDQYTITIVPDLT